MTVLIITAAALGVGLAMDAFSVSLANGLADQNMSGSRMFAIAGTFAGFQTAMPLIGWLLVSKAAEKFEWFRPFIPWIALILLLIIGAGLIKDGIEEYSKNKSAGAPDESAPQNTDGAKLGFAALMMQGVATSIDALSVGFTIADYTAAEALASALIIGIVTLLICLAGLKIGRKLGTLLAGRASVFGGLILIAIGLEIWVKGVLL